MVLNRAAKREAGARLGALRKAVNLEVFTLSYEDSVCRETRQSAEELAEISNRLAVEISDALESGDHLRKFRIDALPAIVVTAKDSAEFRLYGLPGAYAFPILLEAITVTGSLMEPKAELIAACTPSAESNRRPCHYLDLILSRRQAVSAEAAAVFWRSLAALKTAAFLPDPVGAIRIIEDFPFWAPRCSGFSPPVLFLDGQAVRSWPFTDLELVELLKSLDPEAVSGASRSAI